MEIKDFTKYFNYGYFLAKFEPAFLKKLLSTVGDDSEISEPLKAGMSQINKEKFIAKTKQSVKGINKSVDKNKEIER